MRPQRFAVLVLLATLVQQLSAADVRVGMIGLDTSHVTAFTALLNDDSKPSHIPGARVVAAFKGGSPDIESSWSRVEGYTTELATKHGVKICGTIEELLANVDAVMIESVDGRPHLQQAIPVIRAGKPLYIDKPVAGSLKDAVEIFRLAKEARAPIFSASSLRFGKKNQAVRNGSLGKVLEARASSPCHLEKTHPDLFWYGVHGVESLFTVMGTGCESVKRGTAAGDLVEVVGKWKGGRTGTFLESKNGYGGRARGEKGETEIGNFDGYDALVVEVVKFFQTKVAPVSPEETIELFAFMEAADESKRQGGAEVLIADVLKKAGAK